VKHGSSASVDLSAINEHQGMQNHKECTWKIHVFKTGVHLSTPVKE
jgi:hypothetical protein